MRRLVGSVSAVKLDEEVASDLLLKDEVMPHEALGNGRRSSCTAPINTYLRLSVQEARHGTHHHTRQDAVNCCRRASQR